MKCIACDNTNPDDGAFCIQCGKQLKDDNSTTEEQTLRKQEPDVISPDPMVIASPSGDTSQSDDVAVSDIARSMTPHQEPSVYPGNAEYANSLGTPSTPNYPGISYSGTPSAPYYPVYSGYPQAQPPNMYRSDVSGVGYPPVPPWFVNQTGGFAPSGYPMAQPQFTQQPVEPRQMASIAKPLPIWLLIICTIATLAFLVALQLTGSDWADGAMHVAIGAIGIAVLLLLFAGVRISLGMLNEANKKRVAQSIGSALAVMLLFVCSGLGLVGQNPLHMAQAHVLEGQKQWQQTIIEYQKGGETPPSSANLARVYDEWGEVLSQSGRYTDAISKFNLVLSYYTTPNEITRAKKDDAIAYYELAQSELSVQKYNEAAIHFKTLQARFASSPEAQKAHGPLATALLGMGKQNRASACSSAIPTYQDLAANFSDTPEGQEAANQLSQLQPVTGHFTSPLPTDAVASVVLTSTPINGNMSQDQWTSIIDRSLSVSVNNDGTFTFDPQKQGTYDLAWVNITSNAIYYKFYYVASDPTKPAYYVAKVGPLCPFDFGDISDPIAHS